jgi:3-oxoadipate enol-lactonase
MTHLNVQVSGDGPPVVLIHAGVADLHSYDGVAGRLPGHTVIRYDLRGFGASPAPDAPFSHLADLVAVLDGLGVGRTALVGNSFGGYVALTFAVTHPGRVTRLALFASALDGWEWGADMESYNEAETAALDSGDLDAAVRVNEDMWVRGPARGWNLELRALSAALRPALRVSLANQKTAGELEIDDDGPSVDERLGAVAAPTLAVSGGADLPAFDAIARHIAARVPHGRYATIPGAGHLLPLERPAEVAALIADLLKA